MPGHSPAAGGRRRVLVMTLAACELVAAGEDRGLFDEWPAALEAWGHSACADMLRDAIAGRVSAAPRCGVGTADFPTVSRDQVSIRAVPQLPG